MSSRWIPCGRGTGYGAAVVEAERDTRAWDVTRRWVESQLEFGERIADVAWFEGGLTAHVRRISVAGPCGHRDLVLRSFASDRFRDRAAGLLTQEARTLRLLDNADEIPAPQLVAVDPAAAHTDDPSLLMTALPGEPCLDPHGAKRRNADLAVQLLAIHRLDVEAEHRPRPYRAWIDPQTFALPDTRRPMWAAARDVVRGPRPEFCGVFLHRDFHPGNVLFRDGRLTGVVDWVETSWGPADLDVAHCATNLAMLYGADAGLAFTDQYQAAGGRLAPTPQARRYWRLIDALAFAGETLSWVTYAWNRLGRDDLTLDVMNGRLEKYIAAILDITA
jgi:aminoglycoside phosphotransferase (APT) family kinase protein